MNNGVTNDNNNVNPQNVAQSTQTTVAQPVPVQAAGTQQIPTSQSAVLPQQVPSIQQPELVQTGTNTQQPNTSNNKKKEKKKKNTLANFFFFIIILLIGYIFYSYKNTEILIAKMKDECTPVSTTKGEKDLDLNSSIVKDLYSKVATTIKEDLVSTTLDDQMKRYLAYRQIAHRKIYDSNCNLFNKTAMEPYICEESKTFMPKAFKEETLEIEIKKLFGENTFLPHANVQLGRSCLAGYQYIAERGEYVSGYCKEEATTQYRVTKKLIKATSRESTITLKEDVQYHAAEQLVLPEHLRSGTYIYTFKLDNNYNYVYISKELEE